MEIGDRVYHHGIRANGYIREVDNDKEKDKYLVEFFWAKYCEVQHGSWRGGRRPQRKWQYCRAESLIPMGEVRNAGVNSVAFNGQRSLDILVRNVCELPSPSQGTDIVINYGNQYRDTRCSLVINSRMMSNKYSQCVHMNMGGSNLAPDVSTEPVTEEGWIAKPFHSMGGENIWRFNEDTARNINWNTHYLQREFPKVREYRAHVFLWTEPKVLLIQEKVIADTDQLCWNKKQGGKFRYVWQNLHPASPEYERLGRTGRADITAMAVRACEQIHYDMGGVDIGKDEGGNMVVFEVNSRMGLREQSMFTYKQAFHALKHININDYMNWRWANAVRPS